MAGRLADITNTNTTITLPAMGGGDFVWVGNPANGTGPLVVNAASGQAFRGLPSTTSFTLQVGQSMLAVVDGFALGVAIVRGEVG